MLEDDNSIAALSRPVICIMAYNEEAHIAETLRSILEGNCDVKPIVKVYANGCTDNTHKIVSEISIQYPSVELVVIKKASKVNAWNIAFKENKNKVLIFADGDITHDPDAIRKILKVFDEHSNIEIACCESWPNSKGLNWEQRLTGFMQIPLNQDFLLGHFYGIRRSAFITHFQHIGIAGLPEGIVGDDAFLDDLVTRDKFITINSKVTFRPPDINDYCKFLARMKWQSEQIQLFRSSQKSIHSFQNDINLLNNVMRKIVGSKSFSRLLVGCFTASTRVIFMIIMKTKIESEYRKLGSVTANGSKILSEATRSISIK